MSVADIAERIDQELAERLPELRRLADAYVALTGGTAPALLHQAEIEQAPEISPPTPSPAEPDPVPVTAPPAPAAPAPAPAAAPAPVTKTAAEIRDGLTAALAAASAAGDDWISPTDLFGGIVGSRERQLSILATLVDEGLVEENGKLRRGRLVRLAPLAAPAPAPETPAVPENDVDVEPLDLEPEVEIDIPISRRVQKELNRAAAEPDALERIFYDDTTRTRIARQVLNACETELRHPSAIATELMHNRQETSYVMRELAKHGLLVEHDGKYGKAA